MRCNAPGNVKWWSLISIYTFAAHYAFQRKYTSVHRLLYLLNVHKMNEKKNACKEGQSNVVEQTSNIQFKTIGINLNAQHVNGMTHGKVI